ncbi:MAG TPA: hypothetical protein DD738_08310 [Ruminiclostridium sp.]|nr:hypothetical protein [Ruminiclostridium sp.]
MDRTSEKLNRFSYTVMKEAEKKKNELIAEAEKLRREAIDTNEIRYLKMAYEHIQDVVHKLDKEINEEISRAIIEGKQSLFARREENIQNIFQNVREKLLTFRQSDEYKGHMRNLIDRGLQEAGAGELCVLADSEDLPLLEEIRAEKKNAFEVSESEDELLGGCLFFNKTRGCMLDLSFANRLREEKGAFLENYGISLD